MSETLEELAAALLHPTPASLDTREQQRTAQARLPRQPGYWAPVPLEVLTDRRHWGLIPARFRLLLYIQIKSRRGQKQIPLTNAMAEEIGLGRRQKSVCLGSLEARWLRHGSAGREKEPRSRRLPVADRCHELGRHTVINYDDTNEASVTNSDDRSPLRNSLLLRLFLFCVSSSLLNDTGRSLAMKLDLRKPRYDFKVYQLRTPFDGDRPMMDYPYHPTNPFTAPIGSIEFAGVDAFLGHQIVGARRAHGADVRRTLC